MPSRSRRGGPGVGISDVDTQILETLRRRRACFSPPLFASLTRNIFLFLFFFLCVFFTFLQPALYFFIFCFVGENDPLIPAHTQLLLTTDSARVRAFAGGDAGSDSELNTSAYERYFDKPEVIRAYREQQLIQTPEYTLLSEHEAVGGRFRPRGQDDVRVLIFFSLCSF